MSPDLYRYAKITSSLRTAAGWSGGGAGRKTFPPMHAADDDPEQRRPNIAIPDRSAAIPILSCFLSSRLSPSLHLPLPSLSPGKANEYGLCRRKELGRTDT